MQQVLFNIRKNIYYLFSAIIFAIASTIHWAIPLVVSVAGISVTYIYIYPESSLAIFLLGRPLIKGLLVTSRDSFVLVVSLVILAITTLGIWAKYKSFPHKVTLFHISVSVLVVWVLTCLLWSPRPDQAIRRLSIWIFEIILPMFIAYILVLKGLKINKLVNHIIIFGIIMIIISVISKVFGNYIPMDRFSPVSNKILYSRSMGFLFLSSVWLFDKQTNIKRLFIIFIGLASLYFLISSATRAPFIITIFLSGIYLIFFSNIQIKTKVLFISFRFISNT